MKFLSLLIFFFAFVSCGHDYLETSCGCDTQRSNREQYLVTASIQSDGGSSLGTEVYEELLLLVEEDRRDIYGICLENNNRRERVIFCAEDRREYDDVVAQFTEVNFRSEVVENSFF